MSFILIFYLLLLIGQVQEASDPYASIAKVCTHELDNDIGKDWNIEIDKWNSIFLSGKIRKIFPIEYSGNEKVLQAEINKGLTVYAYLGYLSLFILFIYSIKKWQKYRHEKPRKTILPNKKPTRKLLAKPTKKETPDKRIEALEKELKSTKIQLVIKAKENEDKERVLQLLSEKLHKIHDSDSSSNMKWKEIFRIIESRQQIENNTFQIHMDELNQAFTQKLKSAFPSLTMYDLRLCTYIKTGLSTKEISEMMHVLPSSINVSRSRLRKKLNLQAKDDLFSFLEGI